MSNTRETVKAKIIQVTPYRDYIAIGITAFGLWFELMFFPYWQLYFIPAIFGGLVVSERASRGFLVGFLGMMGALLVYMNITLLTGIEAVEALMGAALGYAGLGFIAHVVFLLILATFSGLGGIIGVYLYPFVPFYENLKT
ncbi:MAG: hypothetical protein ACW98F_10990 [Candidatus Hodarchaeales archaeon]|jgi:hypothetical protein